MWPPSARLTGGPQGCDTQSGGFVAIFNVIRIIYWGAVVYLIYARVGTRVWFKKLVFSMTGSTLLTKARSTHLVLYPH